MDHGLIQQSNFMLWGVLFCSVSSRRPIFYQEVQIPHEGASKYSQDPRTLGWLAALSPYLSRLWLREGVA